MELSKSRRLVSKGTLHFIAIAAVTLASAPIYGQENAPNLTPAQIAEIAIPSVVVIKTPIAVGSGFVAAPEGKIVTNFHVIRGAGQATVVTSDRAEHKDVEVIALDEAHDLAVLRISAPGLKPLPLADSNSSKPGEHVVAIGNPLGLGVTVSDGLLSGIREFSKATFLQISAPISRGSSGGPVLNDRGEVIGVSTFLIAGGQNLNFAVPINAVKRMLEENKGTPLAASAAAIPRRNIPNHPLSLLDRCPAPQLQTVVGAISRAINVGAPLYNQGNIEACYRIYEGAALEAQRSVAECPGPKQALADGLSNADKLSTWSEKAWTMRDSFDGILAVARQRGTIERHVPEVPQSVIDECPSEDIAAIATSISAAINSGAPLFDSGNVEACFRIYQGAIGEIDRKFSRCQAVREILHDGIRNAGRVAGWPAKAWALRDSFDGLLNAAGKHQSASKM